MCNIRVGTLIFLDDGLKVSLKEIYDRTNIIGSAVDVVPVTEPRV